ncbi:nuclear protein localization protein 4 [Coemansia sp. S16]|nr:nuclear protein localization protein 4 [Coemansia sp. S16]KAJ2058295.1 nuclear protein localization protein 4 [Coemansia sp. S2]KAJ2349428.1 nuclear protein localization protein 4 [Coemansia sp. RSA 2673]
MLIRIRSPDGMHRIEAGLKDTLAQLLEKLTPVMNAPSPDAIVLTRDVGGQNILAEFEQSIISLGLKHGDMLFATVAPSARPSVEPTSAQASAGGGSNKPAASGGAGSFVVQEDVDSQLEKDDGLIRRKRDTKFCKHGANAMCEYCTPTEPYDAGYLAENKIKHMSFHSYLRKILSQSKIRGDISGAVPPNIPLPLEDLDYRVKPNCLSGHAPWPEGICTKCQPSAVTLQRQPFRMVDNVEFASSAIIDRLLSFWRSTRCQRFGFLYGRYDRSPDVPLGIKAIVEAIYEPKQGWEEDGIKIDVESEDFDNEVKRADAVANACGLKVVGMIFTDLEPTNESGRVVYRRHANSYFLTSLECRLAAYMELKYPNASRWARGGHFGSKFVTCCVSGNEDGDIAVTAWQLSNSAMALQAANLIVPSSVPSKMCVLEPTKTRYVPDVFYKYTNEYNLPVTANAKPAFPVEYLLVNLTHGFPKDPNPMFHSDNPFCIENRDHLHQVQTLGLLKRHINSAQGASAMLAVVLADFHFLVYLASLDILGPNDVALIGRIVRDSANSVQLAEELLLSSGWQTLSLMLQEASDSDLNHSAAAGQAIDQHSTHGAPAANPSINNNSATSAAAASPWACRHCTFVNSPSHDSCDMCALPKD